MQNNQPGTIKLFQLPFNWGDVVIKVVFGVVQGCVLTYHYSALYCGPLLCCGSIVTVLLLHGFFFQCNFTGFTPGVSPLAVPDPLPHITIS